MDLYERDEGMFTLIISIHASGCVMNQNNKVIQGCPIGLGRGALVIYFYYKNSMDITMKGLLLSVRRKIYHMNGPLQPIIQRYRLEIFPNMNNEF